MIPATIIEIGDTGYWTIAADEVTTPRCLRANRLDWDLSISELPEVASLGPGDVVVDVGAFIGDTTKVFLDLGCTVHAFECQHLALECLRHNCPGAIIHPVACGNGSAYITYEGGVNYGALFCIPNWEGQRSRRIDDLDLNALDFLKVDTEGYEPFVLDGARQTILKFKPPIHIEINWRGFMRYGFTEQSILGKLADLGYHWREVRRCDNLQWDALCTANE